MASPTPLLFFLLLTLLHTAVKSQPAAAPTASPLNLTGILDKNGQYTTLIRLLSITHIDNQIENQLNTSSEGLTILAPTDNAFNNLQPGTLNGLSQQQQVALILYHVLPKFYKLSDFDTISNPARTQASGSDGGLYTLNFTSMTNQVNVSTGIVETPINNAIYSTFPLGVFQVDKVLLPLDLFGAKPPSTSPPPTVSSKSPPSTPAKGPSSSSSSSSPSQDSSGAVSRVGGKSITVGAIAGLVCMGALL